MIDPRLFVANRLAYLHGYQVKKPKEKPEHEIFAFYFCKLGMKHNIKLEPCGKLSAINDKVCTICGWQAGFQISHSCEGISTHKGCQNKRKLKRGEKAAKEAV